ncbi:MAG: agmatine deiminase family protein, partial [Methanomicrobiales archaeon]|nr:agmatine deiminase family protein [Methanomicrobiales archaeon]
KYGYRMPAEWELHEGIWLAWPYREETFPRLQDVAVTYTRMIHAIHLHERVHLLVRHAPMEAHVSTVLQNAGVRMDRVDLHMTDYADVWLRDSGPTFVINRREKKLALVGWKFNAWGEKYSELVRDEAIPIRLKEMLGLPLFKPGIILEGGSIDVNGRGVVMTTEQCLLNPNRNPTMSRREIERYLQEYLGMEQVLWLQEGIAGDDTDGHIDDIARFADPKTILCAVEEDRGDENFSNLQGNLHILQKARDQEGNPFRIIPVPMPDHIERDTRLPASYLNFYIGNQVVLVPVFGVENDARALDIISKAFPKRDVVGIDCQALVQGLGTLHCVSQQQPVI